MRFLLSPVIILIFLAGIISACNECNDCGPGSAYPFFKIRFFNIDSLIKVEEGISIAQDSLDSLNVLIAEGGDEYIPARDQLQNELSRLFVISNNIQNGKIRVESVSGIGTDKIIYYRDSVTHDSLTVFNFPLSMDVGIANYIVDIYGRKDTLSVLYNLETKTLGQSILIRAYELNVSYHTYDSLKISCISETCLSNATTISVYF